MEFWDSHFGSPETKSHLDVAPVEGYRVYFMAEGDGFPQIRAMVSLVSLESVVVCLSTKGAPESELTTLGLIECRLK